MCCQKNLCRWMVLIETYWNVNIPDYSNPKMLRSVLIETYWNVNLHFASGILWTALY